MLSVYTADGSSIIVADVGMLRVSGDFRHATREESKTEAAGSSIWEVAETTDLNIASRLCTGRE
jgi:hypothetical protein